eukprot:2883691-Karenia_brevis.AAC.1
MSRTLCSHICEAPRPVVTSTKVVRGSRWSMYGRAASTDTNTLERRNAKSLQSDGSDSCPGLSFLAR